jgi:nucleophosmin 3
VHLIGQHLVGALVEEFEDMEEMEEEMVDEEEGDDSQFKVSYSYCTCLHG